MAAAADHRDGLPRVEDDRREGEEEGEEEEVESDEEGGDDDGSEAASLADLCDPDAGSDEDPTLDPAADGDREVEAVLRSRMARMSISGRKDRKGPVVPKMGKEEIDLLAVVDRLMQDGQLEKLKVHECKAYLRMHKLRLSGKKEVLLNRIREHIEVKNLGEVKYPLSSFLLNCKGDACKGDVVMFEQNIYKRKKGAPREVKGCLCGQRTNAGRIIKESYGIAKQQHTFTIEILWSKGYKPWPPLHPLLIKGRNLYKDKTMRQPWPDEEERNRVLQEKHARGFLARKSRAVRIQDKEIEKMRRLNRIKENKSKEQENMNRKSSQQVLPQQKVASTNTVPQRSDDRKAPSLQDGEPGNTRQQQISSKQTPTKQLFHYQQQSSYHQHRNQVLPQEGVARTSRPEVIDHQAPSLQHGEPGNTRQQQISSKPTPTQQTFKYPQQHPNHHHRKEVLLQEGTTRTSKQEFIDRQAPTLQEGSGNTRQQQKSSKPTATQQMFKNLPQPPKNQHHNEVLPQEGAKRTHRVEFIDRQNDTYHGTEYDESAFQHHGMFTQHAKAHQHGSSGHQHVHADHQLHQPLRPRNQDFHSRGQIYGEDYHDHGQMTRDQYHPQERQHQNHYGRRQMTQDRHHPQQNHHQNYHDGRRMNQNQYHPQQNHHQNYHDSRTMNRNQYHPQLNYHQNYHDHGRMNRNQYPQWFRQLQPCRYYQQGWWCPYGENLQFSHDN